MEAGRGRRLPVDIWYKVIIATGPRVGEMVLCYGSFDGEHQHVEPHGTLLCDGRAYRRRDFPKLAEKCRQHTSWLRWHVGREFNVPDLSFQVGVDYDR
jgi:hypothetical protein